MTTRETEEEIKLALPKGMVVDAPIQPGYAEILTPHALAFVAELARRFTGKRDELLRARDERQKRIEAGELPDFLPETKSIREGDWKVAPIPKDLLDRRVEITGPVDAKMVINALNSGAKVFMADFEDSLAPTWEGVIEGQFSMRGAINRNLKFSAPNGKEYKLNDSGLATLIVRPRGWHLNEKHITVDGKQVPGGLVDFGLYFFHNAKNALAAGTGPYFYLPKLESHKEAALWAEVFNYAEDTLELKRGTIKATVLIETILAAFEMDEILYELKDYCVGLNCGRWDYIFSFIKKFRHRPDFVLPERGQVTMKTHFLTSYSQLLIKTTHRRGAFAMGGMAAQIPVKGDEEANNKAFAAVKADKEREAGNGHDGTWVAHPGLVPVAMEVFDRVLKDGRTNQLDVLREDVNVTAADLLAIPEGTITEKGLRNNINVSIYYLAAWLAGNGCVPIHNLMEDAATAEISRSQIWQWVRHGSKLDDGRAIDFALFDVLLKEELDGIRIAVGDEAFTTGTYQKAAQIFAEFVKDDRFVDFLTLPAYELI
ncbi:MAG: malate synthase A [Alphaproteobacteria bacterium]|nr:malate synthase A [Alphaproteobacteria bacterium]